MSNKLRPFRIHLHSGCHAYVLATGENLRTYGTLFGLTTDLRDYVDSTRVNKPSDMIDFNTPPAGLPETKDGLLTPFTQDQQEDFWACYHGR